MNIQIRKLINRLVFIAGGAFIASFAHAGEQDELKLALFEILGPRAATSEIVESPMKDVYQVNLGSRVFA